MSTPPGATSVVFDVCKKLYKIEEDERDAHHMSSRVPLPKNFMAVCKSKGEAFFKAMHSSDADAAKILGLDTSNTASQFTQVSDMAKWGWYNDPLPDDNRALMIVLLSLKAPGLFGEVFGLLKKDSDFRMIDVVHDKAVGPSYTVLGEKYRMTGAYYQFTFHPCGAIVTLTRKSPKYAGNGRRSKVLGAELPDLQAFSDIAWLKWIETFGTEPVTMRYFLTTRIVNKISRTVFDRVMREAGPCAVSSWPGQEVAADSENGRALLGTPDAYAFSFFLIQHKERLGNLRIHKITIFFSDQGEANMLFHVELAPKDDEAA